MKITTTAVSTSGIFTRTNIILITTYNSIILFYLCGYIFFNVIVTRVQMAQKFSRVEAKNKLDPIQKMLVPSLEALTHTPLQTELPLPSIGSQMKTDSSLPVSICLLLHQCLSTSSRC